MRYEKIETTIETILALDYHSEGRVYGLDEFTIFQPLSNLDTWGMDIETEKKIIERDYVEDNCNDCRSRALRVILYNDTPFAIYQYMGRGNVENEIIFNKEVYEQLLKDYISEYLQKLNTPMVASVTDTYVIKNYNMAYFEVEDNKIIADSEYGYGKIKG